MPAHLLLSHFPIALIVLGAVLDLAALLLGRVTMRRAAGALLIAGAVIAFATFLTGQGALMRALGADPPDPGRVEIHTRWGGAGVWLLAGAGVLRALWRERLSGLYGYINLASALLAAAVIVAISVTGTAIRHGG